jgi:hypothetical protein
MTCLEERILRLLWKYQTTWCDNQQGVILIFTVYLRHGVRDRLPYPHKMGNIERKTYLNKQKIDLMLKINMYFLIMEYKICK